MTRSMSKYIFAVYSCFHNSVCHDVSPEEVAKDIPVQRPVAKVTPLLSYTCCRRDTYTLHRYNYGDFTTKLLPIVATGKLNTVLVYGLDTCIVPYC